MYAGYRIASREDYYDAFWLLNSDVSFDYGNTVLRELVTVLFSSENYAQISPQHNSWHPFMERAEGFAAVRRELEPTATLIKRSTIERVGFWDLDMTRGYGIDPDYGYRIRSAGLLSILTNRARIHHKQHQSMDDFDDYHRRAHTEANAALSQKYGSDWLRIFSEE
jgi:GT2 family glycosyltransferase